MNIRFGTSGWRAIIAEDFTFANVELVTNAICSYLKRSDEMKGRPLIIGHDTRFMGEKFQAAASEIARKKGFQVLKCTHPVPTPTVSHAILSNNAAGAINFTASHNPPEYQGIKFSTSDGAPAMPEVTKQIEAAVEANEAPKDTVGGSITDHDPRAPYLKDLETKVNFDAIA